MKCYEALLDSYYPKDRARPVGVSGRDALRRSARGDLPRHRAQELRLLALHRGARSRRRRQLLRHLRRAAALRSVLRERARHHPAEVRQCVLLDARWLHGHRQDRARRRLHADLALGHQGARSACAPGSFRRRSSAGPRSPRSSSNRCGGDDAPRARRAQRSGWLRGARLRRALCARPARLGLRARGRSRVGRRAARRHSGRRAAHGSRASRPMFLEHGRPRAVSLPATAYDAAGTGCTSIAFLAGRSIDFVVAIDPVDHAQAQSAGGPCRAQHRGRRHARALRRGARRVRRLSIELRVARAAVEMVVAEARRARARHRGRSARARQRPGAPLGRCRAAHAARASHGSRARAPRRARASGGHDAPPSDAHRRCRRHAGASRSASKRGVTASSSSPTVVASSRSTSTPSCATVRPSACWRAIAATRPTPKLELCVGGHLGGRSRLTRARPGRASVLMRDALFPLPLGASRPVGRARARRPCRRDALPAQAAPARREPIDLRLGAAGVTPLAIPVEPGSCYVAAVAATAGEPRSMTLTAKVDARIAFDANGGLIDGSAVAFCSGGVRPGRSRDRGPRDLGGLGPGGVARRPAAFRGGTMTRSTLRLACALFLAAMPSRWCRGQREPLGADPKQVAPLHRSPRRPHLGRARGGHRDVQRRGPAAIAATDVAARRRSRGRIRRHPQRPVPARLCARLAGDRRSRSLRLRRRWLGARRRRSGRSAPGAHHLSAAPHRAPTWWRASRPDAASSPSACTRSPRRRQSEWGAPRARGAGPARRWAASRRGRGSTNG